MNVVFVTVCLFACACKHTGSFSNHRKPRKVQILVTTTHYASVPHVPDYVHLCFLTAFSLSCSIKSSMFLLFSVFYRKATRQGSSKMGFKYYRLNRRCTSTAWSTQVGWMNIMWLQSEEGKEVKNTAVSLWIDLILKHYLKRKPKTKLQTGVFLLLDELEWILLTLPLIHPYLFDAYNHRYTVPHPPSPFQFFHFFTSI